VTLRLVLFGAPGAGKGTQARLLVERFGLTHISTGDIFRRAIRERSDLGLQAQTYMDAGKLVPDEIVIGLVRDLMDSGIGDRGFVFDGYPRTVPQAKSLSELLGFHRRVGAVVSLEVDREHLIGRISGRQAAEHRKDDAGDAVRVRLDAFAAQTLPLKRYYADMGLLVEVDGTGSPEEVFSRIESCIAEKGLAFLSRTATSSL
jgi:adenylate kinase